MKTILMIYPVGIELKYTEDDYTDSVKWAKSIFKDVECKDVYALMTLVAFRDCYSSSPSNGDYMGYLVKYIIDKADIVFFCKGWNFCDINLITIAKQIAKLYKKRIIYEENL